MIVYIDLLIILNFFFDFLLLLTVNVTLKRNIKFYRLIIGALFGELSLVLLFINNFIILVIFKLLFGVILNIVCFGYKSFIYTLNNYIYFFMSSVILGGFMYYLNQNNIPYYFVLLISPMIFILYYIQNKNIKNNVSNYFNISIYFTLKKIINCNAYLDTGNKLKDPITKKDIILINKKLISSEIRNRTPIYVPYYALNHNGIVECLKVKKVVINNKINSNVLVGVMDKKFGIEEVDCIIGNNILEGLHD